jgi:hypothetical protein
MESKWNEEHTKRQRVEERAQVMKTFIQKNKVTFPSSLSADCCLSQDKAISTESQLASRDEMVEMLHQKFAKMKRETKLLQESYSEERRRRADLEKERDAEREKRERAERLNREVSVHSCCCVSYSLSWWCCVAAQL